MALSASHIPSREVAFAGGPTIERLTPATITVTTGTTPVTMTTAQLMTKLIPVDCQDTGTLTLPTAKLIGTTYEGIYVGDVIPFTLINFGDTTLTLAVGTGITAKVITTKTTALTIVAYASAKYWLVCTAAAIPSDPSSAYTFDLYGAGPTAAAVA
jgi:hypothetical protein